ncbi:MAG TPA: carboxylesterase family protein [Mucilaginibacter sp.]|nr:carboxylesterase family protein [Mucilaginibacter sp.]
MYRLFKPILFSAFWITILTGTSAFAQGSYPVVKTDKGFVKGNYENGIAVFKGIPYAAPPIGKLRYMPPIVHKNWSDTLLTQSFGSIATQSGGNDVRGNEDCLTLNLYTPKTDDHKRAVLVWIHGGSMIAGAGKGEDGHRFADNDDIVTITINYRLGAFGFMYLGDLDKRYAESGNNGLLDCVAALTWIKHNIAAFGGDPDRVTIMGESAGGKLLSAVSVSPKSRGLFQQIIAESGSVQCIRDSVTAKNERSLLLQQLGLGPKDARKLLTLPADVIMKAQAKVCDGIGGNSFFGPVYDGIAITEDAYRYAGSSRMPHIRAMIGTNRDEAALFVSEKAWSNQPESTILKPLFKDDYPMVYKTYEQQLKTGQPYDAAVKVLTQYMYQMHSYRFARALSQNDIPVWMYRFNFNNGKKYGAMHAAELQYVWNDPNLKQAEPVREQLASTMHQAWAAFIKTGNPDHKNLPHWPQYHIRSKQVMSFDKTNAVIGLDAVFDDKTFPSQVFLIKNQSTVK